jgi:hypothetical protein
MPTHAQHTHTLNQQHGPDHTQLRGRISLFLSHDWPNRITQYGDSSWLFRKKSYFQTEVRL